MAGILDWLFGAASPADVSAAKADIEDARQNGRIMPASSMDTAHQAALRALLGADAKARNPLAGDLPLSSTDQLPPASSGGGDDQGGVRSDAEDEQKQRQQGGGLRAPVLEAWGLVPKAAKR